MEDKLKHTPGPWTAIRLNSTDACAAVVLSGSVSDFPLPSESKRISINHGGFLDEEVANAKLIAAAPDLLTACLLAYVKLTSIGEFNCDATAKILSKAIEKATQ